MIMRDIIRSLVLATLAAIAPVLLAAIVYAETAPPVEGATAKAATGLPISLQDVPVGSSVFGSDGKKIGVVKGVKSEAGGNVQEIHIKTAAELGLGGRIIVIPGDKIARAGATIEIAMTASEISVLPAVGGKKS